MYNTSDMEQKIRNTTLPKGTFKYIMFLGMLFVIINTLADVLAYKMIFIGLFLMSVGVFIVPFSYAISDIVTEVYGYKLSRQVIWYGLTAEFLFDLVCYVTSLSKSPSFFNNDIAYTKLLHPLLNIYMVVLIANIISDFVNIYCISKWKIILKGKYFWLRIIGSSFIAQLIFTVICDGLVFSNELSGNRVFQTIVSTFMVKMFCVIILAFPMTLIVNIIKLKENIDVYDYKINFNPFKISI